MPQTSHRPRWSAVLLMVTSLIVGCSSQAPERVAIHGGIQYDGTMVKAGRIHFIPTGSTKGPSATATIQDGFYEFDRKSGPVVGTHRVEIESAPAVAFALDDEAAYAAAAAKTAPNRSVIPQDTIPAVYNRKSTLTATIERGEMKSIDFVLERPEKPTQASR
jgi:hypothetical protein